MFFSRLTQFVALTAAVCGAADVPEWHPPTAGDSRGPCPGLNTLANHGFLPHDGKNISIPMFIKAIDDAFNIPSAISAPVAASAIGISPNAAAGVIDLANLNLHNAIEHDGSLSRADAAHGDQALFNQTVFDQVLKHFKGSSTVSVAAAAEARYDRIKTSRKTNPTFSYLGRQIHISYLETALYLTAMNDPKTGTVPVDWVKILFEQERIPVAEGWTRRKDPLVALQVTSLILELALATGEKIAFK